MIIVMRHGASEENIQKVEEGKVTISNHIHPMDCTMNALVNFPCRTYFTSLASNFKIPVIALTADAIAGSKEKYISEGFFDYIAKPFNKDQIKEKLDKVFVNK